MTDPDDAVMRGFHKNNGQVGGCLAGANVALLTTIGAENPGFAAYQEKTSRLIPIVELRRA